MSATQDLKKYLEEEVLPELEAVIDSIFKKIEQDKGISLGEREELEELQEMHKECRDILIEIESGEMDDMEAKELLDELISIANES